MKLFLVLATALSSAAAFTFVAPQQARSVQGQGFSEPTTASKITFTQLYSEPEDDDEEGGLDLDLGEMFEM
jgi:hypothetical protein